MEGPSSNWRHPAMSRWWVISMYWLPQDSLLLARVMGCLPIRTPLFSPWLFIHRSASLTSFSMTLCKYVFHPAPFSYLPLPSSLAQINLHSLGVYMHAKWSVSPLFFILFNCYNINSVPCFPLGLPSTMTTCSINYYCIKSYFSLRQYGYLWLAGGKVLIQVGKTKHKD